MREVLKDWVGKNIDVRTESARFWGVLRAVAENHIVLYHDAREQGSYGEDDDGSEMSCVTVICIHYIESVSIKA